MYMSFLKLMVSLLGFIAIIIVFQAIMAFFNISLSDYILYLVWFIGLGILAAILPKKFTYFTK